MKSLLAFLLLFAQATLLAAESTPYVLVSVAPYKLFVEKIAGDTVKVELMVPAGASSHTYEPTPKQTLAASHADIWFQIGESFEPRATRALKSYHPEMDIVDLRKGINLIVSKEGDEGCCHCCHHAHDSCIDPHFWLSPREVKIQAATIADALIERYPQHRRQYEDGLKELTQELEGLDREITDILAPLKNRIIMVSHPAYAYFCRDYQIKQLSIEFEGKDPTPQQLTRVLKQAQESHIKSIFIQMQYNNKGARLIAKEIGAEVVTLDPYAEQYFASLREIARAIWNSESRIQN